MPLPIGYRARPATIDDVETIFEIQSAHDTPIIGGPNATLADVADELLEPQFDCDNDSWLVLTDDGSPAGWGWTCRKGTSDNVDISVHVHPGHEPLAGWLWDTTTARAAEIAKALGHPSVTVDIGIFPSDKLLIGVAAERGFTASATFVRMRIDHLQQVPYPATPAGITVGHGTEESVRRHANDVRNLAFADHFGFTYREYDDWVAEREANSSHDWSMVHVAYAGGEPVAVVMRTNNFVPDENCGYVMTLGTVPAYQGKGLGGHLLRYAFAADAEQGRAGTILHVDTNPDRPALALYQRHGMCDVLTIDVWRRTLNT